MQFLPESARPARPAIGAGEGGTLSQGAGGGTFLSASKECLCPDSLHLHAGGQRAGTAAGMVQIRHKKELPN